MSMIEARIDDERTLLSFESVRAWYGTAPPVLESGGMSIPSNAVVGLVGKNGVGKTTLINSLCGIHPTAEFKTLMFGRSPCAPHDMRFKHDRYVCFAQDGSFRFWSLCKLIAFVEQSFSTPPDEAYREWLLEGFGLTEIIDVRLGTLSDGQRKKAALCSALCARRSLLFLDEPVDFLDFSSTEFLYEAVRSYAATYGSILLCSHVAESITRCCTRLYSLDGGALAGPFVVPENPADVSRVLAR